MSRKSLFPASSARVEVTQESHNFSNTTQYICDDSHYFQNHQSPKSNDIKNRSSGFETEIITETTAAKTILGAGLFSQTGYQNDVIYRQNELYKRLVNAHCNESEEDTILQSIERKSICLRQRPSKQLNSKAKKVSSCSPACSPTKPCKPRQPEKIAFQPTTRNSNLLAKQAGDEILRMVVPKKKTVTRSVRDLSSRAYGHTSSSYRKISDPAAVKRGNPSKKSD